MSLSWHTWRTIWRCTRPNTTEEHARSKILCECVVMHYPPKLHIYVLITGQEKWWKTTLVSSPSVFLEKSSRNRRRFLRHHKHPLTSATTLHSALPVPTPLLTRKVMRWWMETRFTRSFQWVAVKFWIELKTFARFKFHILPSELKFDFLAISILVKYKVLKY